MPRRPVHWLALFLGACLVLTGVELALRVRYRWRVLPPPAADAMRRVVVVLGDSIVAGAPGHPAEAWPARLAGRLQAVYPQVRWHVVNAGVSGDTAPLGYQRFARAVAAHRPDAVLIAFGLNDCNPGRYGLDLWLEQRTPGGLGRSYMWQAAWVRLERLGRRLGWLSPPCVEPASQPLPRTSPEGFTKALAALVARVRVIGARPVLLTMTPLAEGATPAVEARRSLYPAYNERIRRLAALEKIPLVEFRAAMPATAFTPDGVHLTAAGQAWVADQVYEQLAAQGFWQPLVPDGGGK